MKIVRNLCLFISILAFISLCVDAKASHAAIFHVATSGSDSNPGTAVAPFRTVTKCVKSMSGGDTCLLHGGTYAEGNLTPPSGSDNAPTRIQAAPGEQVIIQPTGSEIDTIFDFQAGRHHITLDRLILDGNRRAGFPIYGAPDVSHISLRNSEVKNGLMSGMLIGGSHWEIRNNHIHHNGTNCCTTGNDDHGIYMSAGYSRIIGNRFDNNACYNIQNYGGSNPTENVYDGNTFTASKCGVTLTKGGSHLFINNVIYDDATANGNNALLIFTGNTKVYNNTFAGVNIVTVNQGDTASVQIRNNIVMNGGIETTQATLSNNMLSDPKFMSAGAGDFRLAASSTAIDAGMRLSEVAADRNGTARPQGAGYDIGAYEFDSGTTPVSVPAPRDLRAVSQP